MRGADVESYIIWQFIVSGKCRFPVKEMTDSHNSHKTLRVEIANLILL